MTGATRPRRTLPSTARTRPGVRVIDRAVDILACFIETSESLTLRDIAVHTGIHKATAFRILATLVEDGILEQAAPGEPYELGFFPLRCADAILGADPLRERALPVMTRLRDELNETVVLAQRRGNSILNLDKIVSRHGIVETPTIGVSMPLHEASAGLAILSTFGEDALHAHLAAIDPPPTPVQRRTIAERLRHAKAQGAVLTHGDRQSPILAAPITDSSGEAVAALSIAIPSGRADPRLVQLCLAKLIEAARQLALPRPPRAAAAD